jgi:hypothetical protein
MQLLAPTLFHCMQVLAGLHFFPDSRRQGYMGKALAQSLTLHAFTLHTFTLHTFRLAYKDSQTARHTQAHLRAHTDMHLQLPSMVATCCDKQGPVQTDVIKVYRQLA